MIPILERKEGREKKDFSSTGREEGKKKKKKKK